MYVIKSTKKFRKAIKKLSKSGGFSNQELETVIDLLAENKNLPAKHQDHKLTGELHDYRECHIKFDLLLVYKINKERLILILVGIGSHEDLF